MLKIARALVALSLSLGVGLAAQAALAQDWVKVAPIDGKYVIHMPVKPEEQSQRLDSPVGPAALHQYIAAVSAHETYISSYFEARDPLVSDGSADRHLRMAEAGTLRSFPGSTLRMDRETSLDGYPGRIFMIDLGNDTVYTACIYVVGNRLYQNVAMTPKAMAGGADTIRFFDSFAIRSE
jgi:hypothetical protein